MELYWKVLPFSFYVSYHKCLIVNYNKIDLILQFFPLILHYFCQVHADREWKAFLHVHPRILSWIEVWTLTLLLQDNDIVVLKSFLCRFGFMFESIVLLESKSSPELQVQNPSAFPPEFPSCFIQPRYHVTSY